MKCPTCGKHNIKPYGYIKARDKGFVVNVKRYRCDDCLRQFTGGSKK
jgi:transposase-like protein